MPQGLESEKSSMNLNNKFNKITNVADLKLDHLNQYYDKDEFDISQMESVKTNNLPHDQFDSSGYINTTEKKSKDLQS